LDDVNARRIGRQDVQEGNRLRLDDRLDDVANLDGRVAGATDTVRVIHANIERHAGDVGVQGDDVEALIQEGALACHTSLEIQRRGSR
jgi:hypothetical protein